MKIGFFGINHGPCADPATAGAVARAVSDRQRQDFPEYFAAQRAAAPGFGRRQFYCIGPLQYTGQAAAQTDIDNLKEALAGVQTVEAFIPAVAVGTVEHWIANAYYPSDEAFLFALADALPVAAGHQRNAAGPGRREAGRIPAGNIE